MYQHRAEEARFDCVDLDPYGSAVPFLDAAMNAIADGGACLILPFPLLTQSGLCGVSCRLAEQRLLLGLNLRAHRLDVCYVYGYGRPRRSQLSGKGVSLPLSLLSSLFVSLRRLTRVRVHVQLYALRRRLRQRRVLSRSRAPFFLILSIAAHPRNVPDKSPASRWGFGFQGLRLVLHSLATTAARYGRYIEPQLSLSIDFYVRLFIRVRTGPKEVKAVPS